MQNSSHLVSPAVSHEIKLGITDQSICIRGILISASKDFRTPIAIVTGFAFLKLLLAKELNHSGGNVASSAHAGAS
jgi:hypothetical protein